MALAMFVTVACSVYVDGDLLPLSEGNTWEYTGGNQKLLQKVQKTEGGAWVLSTSMEGLFRTAGICEGPSRP